MNENDIEKPKEPTVEQKAIIDASDGFLIVDAGPGTGKTFTMVRRYAELVRRKGLGPRDILMLTFGNKAADEMGSRLKEIFDCDEELRMFGDAVQTRTFDSLCLSIVLDSASEIGELFGTDATISHTASVSTADSINDEYFRRFLDGFLAEHHEEYPGTAPIAARNPIDLFNVIRKMMSFGIIPNTHGEGSDRRLWKGYMAEESVRGDPEEMKVRLARINYTDGKTQSDALKKLKDHLRTNSCGDPPVFGKVKKIDDEIIASAVGEERTELFRFIHDVYLAYIRRCIRDDHLTYELVELLAFSILYENKEIREANRRMFLIIDEFQDTNPLQMMITLMLLSEPNLCVVGDWKQGIYGFRYATIENMRRFEERSRRFRRFLNEDCGGRIPFTIPEITVLNLSISRRSSQEIIDAAYQALLAKGPDGESADDSFLFTEEELDDPERRADIEGDKEEMDRRMRGFAVEQGRNDLVPGDSNVRFVRSSDSDELGDIVKAVKDLVANGHVRTGIGEQRPLGPGDIAVLCPTNEQCRRTVHALRGSGIEAHLVGMEKIMDSREGKLVLAWLRYIVDPKDRKGYVPIMSDLGYPLMDLLEAGKNGVPASLQEQRDRLVGMTDSITDLLTSVFDLYDDLDPDTVQAIVSVLSSTHSSSSSSLTSIISMIEQDIERGTPYDIDVSGNGNAVNVMTMHKAKGLEFPAVVIPFMDDGVLPKENKKRGVFLFDPVIGLRCRREIVEKDGSRWIGSSWRTWLVARALGDDYDEARRVLFVAISRAEQYVILICGDEPSSFIRHYIDDCGCRFEEIPDVPYVFDRQSEDLAVPPEVPALRKRPFTMPVHAIMTGPEEYVAVGGEGKEYGTAIHSLAQLMALRRDADPSICRHGEAERIQEVIDSSEGGICEAEVECLYPVGNTGVTLSGTIDLLIDHGDSRPLEVHDWKTDSTDALCKEYELQLSVYARAVSAATDRPVRAFIHYISNGIGTVEVDDIWSDERIADRVHKVLDTESKETASYQDIRCPDPPLFRRLIDRMQLCRNVDILLRQEE